MHLALLLPLAATGFQEPAGSAPPAAGELPMRAFWQDGLRFESADGEVEIRLGGKLHLDGAAARARRSLEASVGPLTDGTAFRRARLTGSGRLGEQVEFAFGYDFARGTARLLDNYVGFPEFAGIGTLRVGHMREPVGLEANTSASYVSFMERALPVALTPGRNTGSLLTGTAAGERVYWAAGLFRDADDSGGSEGPGGLAGTVRLSGLPWIEDGGRRLLHLGASLSRRDPAGGTLDLDSRPESSLLPDFVDTGPLAVDDQTLIGAEAALVDGPVSLQGEWIRSLVDVQASPRSRFDSWYVEGSWFLTGEHRPYRADEGDFGRVRPRAPVAAGGAGAWQLAARHAVLDLSDGVVGGGELRSDTLGLNWHYSAGLRVLLDASRLDRRGVGRTWLIQARVALDF